MTERDRRLWIKLLCCCYAPIYPGGICMVESSSYWTVVALAYRNISVQYTTMDGYPIIGYPYYVILIYIIIE